MNPPFVPYSGKVNWTALIAPEDSHKSDRVREMPEDSGLRVDLADVSGGVVRLTDGHYPVPPWLDQLLERALLVDMGE